MPSPLIPENRKSDRHWRHRAFVITTTSTLFFNCFYRTRPVTDHRQWNDNFIIVIILKKV
jgi:hypothetical protein